MADTKRFYWLKLKEDFFRQKEIKKLDKYLQSGKQLVFVLGNKTYGRYRWLLESLGESVKYTDKRGNVTQCDLSVSLREYLKE